MFDAGMHNRRKPLLLHLEEESRFLRDYLQSEASASSKCAAFIRFFQLLSRQEERAVFISFYIEFRHWLYQLSHHLPLIGWDPARTEAFIVIIRDFIELGSDDGEGMAEAERRARVLAAAGYLQVGSVDDACRVLGWSVKEEEVLPSEYERAMQVVEYGAEHGLPFFTELRLHIRNWGSRRNRYSNDTLSVLMVEPRVHGEQEEAGEGALVDLVGTALERSRDAEEDRVFLNNNARFGPDSIFWTLIDGVHAARRIVTRQSPLVRFYNFEFSLADKEAQMSGSSLGLASGILSYAALINRYYRASVVGFNRSAAVSGGIQPDGTVGPVDSRGLQAKVSAAFFSPIERLFLPASNLSEAMARLTKLLERYPHRHLSLQGLENLQQAVQDRNLVCQKPFSLWLRLTAMVKRLHHKRIWGLAAAMLILLSVVSQFKELRWWQDRNPVQIDLQDDQLIAKNRAGQSLWSFNLGQKVLAFRYVGPNDIVKFADLDGDGANEILIGMNEPESSELSGTLFCLSNSGRLLWRYNPGRVMTFGTERFSNHYLAYSVCIVPMGPKKLILMAAHHISYYPCVLTLLNEKGEFLGEYWNSGVLNGIAVGDVDGDGITDILAGGCDNESNQAVLVFLDPLHFGGASPQNPAGRYAARGISPGTQKAFLRFARSPFQDGEFRDTIFKIQIYGGTVKVHVANRMMRDNLVNMDESLMYCYNLDSELNLISMEFDDMFKYYSAKRFGREALPDQVASLRRIEYWEGNSWIERTR